MHEKYDLPTIVYPSRMDASGRLSIPDCFALFMDIAAPHAALLGCGTEDLAKRGLFWITVKSKIRILRRPRVMEEILVSTWPEEPMESRCLRDYSITQNGQPLVLGKTLWAVMNMQTGKLSRVDELYPEGFQAIPDIAVPEPFAQFGRNFGGEKFAEYTVRSTDIDFGGHMNNIAYLRALAGMFSAEEWQGMKISEMEIHYKAPCFEGNQLSFYAKNEKGQTQICAALPDGKPAVYVVMQ